MVEIPSSCRDEFNGFPARSSAAMLARGAHRFKLYTGSSLDDNPGPKKKGIEDAGKLPSSGAATLAPELANLLSQHSIPHLQKSIPHLQKSIPHLQKSIERLSLGFTRSFDSLHRNVSEYPIPLTRAESDSSHERLYTPAEFSSSSGVNVPAPAELKLQEFAQELATLKAQRARRKNLALEKISNEIDVSSPLDMTEVLEALEPRKETESDEVLSSRSSEENLAFLDASDDLNDDDSFLSPEDLVNHEKTNSEMNFSFLHSVYHTKETHEEAIVVRMKYAGGNGAYLDCSGQTDVPADPDPLSILTTCNPPAERFSVSVFSEPPAASLSPEIVKEHADILQDTLRKYSSVQDQTSSGQLRASEPESATGSGSASPQQACSSEDMSSQSSRSASPDSTSSVKSLPDFHACPPTPLSFSPGSSQPQSPSSSPTRFTSPPPPRPCSLQPTPTVSPRPTTPLRSPPPASSSRSPTSRSPSRPPSPLDLLKAASISQSPPLLPSGPPSSESPNRSSGRSSPLSHKAASMSSSRLPSPPPPPVVSRPPRSTSSPCDLRHSVTFMNKYDADENSVSEYTTDDEDVSWTYANSPRELGCRKNLAAKMPVTLDGRLVHPEAVLAETADTEDPDDLNRARFLGLFERVKDFAEGCGLHFLKGKEPLPEALPWCIKPEGEQASAELNAALLKRLTCVECGSFCTPPVTFCVWGHVICERCRPVSFWDKSGCRCRVRCPTCSGEMLRQPCALWDFIARSLLYPCRFSRDGCPESKSLNVSEKSRHEAVCSCRRQRCWADGCTWTGVWPQLRTHVVKFHLAKAVRADWYRFVNVCGASWGRSADVIALPANEIVLLHSFGVIGEHRYILQYLNDDGGSGAVLFVPRFRLRVVSGDGRSELEVRGEAVTAHHDIELALRSGRCFRLTSTPFDDGKTTPRDGGSRSVQLCLEKGRASMSC